MTVADNSALVLHLEGSVPEQAPVDVPLPFLGQQQVLTMVDTWQLLRKAAVDNRIKALVLEPQRSRRRVGQARRVARRHRDV